jgi:hypothetical protein
VNFRSKFAVLAAGEMMTGSDLKDHHIVEIRNTGDESDPREL